MAANQSRTDGMFLQLHFLTPYAPGNPNRDELGRPKTAMFGGQERMRISSQCLKRTWRTADAFVAALGEGRSIRTRELGELVAKALDGAGTREQVRDLAAALVPAFGTAKDKPSEAEDEGPKKAGKKGRSKTDGEGVAMPRTAEMTYLSPAEQTAVVDLARKIAKEGFREPTAEELAGLLGRTDAAADVALFGRFFASRPELSVEAACEVAHAISVDRVLVEDDYFSAVDDLRAQGSGHISSREFGSGLLYHYVSVDRGLLVRSLHGNEDLARKALAALAEVCLTVSPRGARASFGTRIRSTFALAEKGSAQPRSLHAAFLDPVTGPDMAGRAAAALLERKREFDQIYGEETPFAAFGGGTSGTKADVVRFFSEP